MLKILILLSLTAAAVSNLTKDKVIAAINCGGPSHVDENGIVYEKV